MSRPKISLLNDESLLIFCNLYFYTIREVTRLGKELARRIKEHITGSQIGVSTTSDSTKNPHNTGGGNTNTGHDSTIVEPPKRAFYFF